MPGTAGLPALLLLALAGGFVFAVIHLPTRYRISRAQGQEVYFYAAYYAVVLVGVSLVLLWAAKLTIPKPAVARIDNLWSSVLGPLDVPSLPPFVCAFVVGYVGAHLINFASDSGKAAQRIIREHGDELEKFLYLSIVDARLVYVAFNNGKVYVGWPAWAPEIRRNPERTAGYFGLLPVRSGYLDETSQPQFTTQYGPVYEQILEGELESLDMTDFEILIPMNNVAVIRPYSLNLPQANFTINPEYSEVQQHTPLLTRFWRLVRSLSDHKEHR